jgi:hypothetical protein
MNQVEKLKNQIKSLNTKIKNIQAKCVHAPSRVQLKPCIEWGEIHDGWNDGNVYPIYCTRIHCKNCSLMWTIEETITLPQYVTLQKKTVAAKKKADARKAKKKPAIKKTATKKVAKKTVKRKA